MKRWKTFCSDKLPLDLGECGAGLTWALWLCFAEAMPGPLRATTNAINDRTNIMRPSAIFVQQSFQNMHTMVTCRQVWQITMASSNVSDNTEEYVKRRSIRCRAGRKKINKVLHTLVVCIPKVDLRSSIMNNRQSHQTNWASWKIAATVWTGSRLSPFATGNQHVVIEKE